MTIEKVTDINYEEFKNSPRSALVVTTSWCRHCANYEPIINTLLKQMPYIKFGKSVIDKEKTSRLKRDYSDFGSWILPTTLLFRDEREVSRIKGSALYPEVLSRLQTNLIIGSLIYVPGRNGEYVPAKIKGIHQGLYALELIGDSKHGKKNTIIKLGEGEFAWEQKKSN